MKVLLVEDDPAIAGSVTTSLSNAGMTVHHCVTGADAIAAVKEFAPEVILMFESVVSALSRVQITR